MFTLLLITVLIYNHCFRRFDSPDADSFDCPCQRLCFESNGQTLQGYLFGSGDTLVVLAPGLGNGAFTYSAQIRYFVEAGRRVFSFDYTGCYGSEGRSCRGFPQAVDDLDAALRFAAAHSYFGCERVYLFGHSMGGYAVCNVLPNHAVSAAVSVGGVNSAMEATISPVYYKVGILAYLHYPFLYLYQGIRFGLRAMRRSAAKAAKEAGASLLLVNGVNDWIAPLHRVSIVSHLRQIACDGVRCLVWAEEGRDGHADLLFGSTHSEANPLLMGEINRFFDNAKPQAHT